MQSGDKYSIYYDGLCPLCSREIDHYRTQPGAERLRFVDITSADFDAAIEGLDPVRVHKEMHVRMPSGEVKTAVDAFVEIWKVLPRYNIAAAVATKPFVKPFLNLGYQAFAKIRPRLPRRQAGCDNSPYCDLPKKAAPEEK